MKPGLSTDLVGDWVPYRLMQHEQRWLCRWLFLAGQRFTEPFFSDTIQVCKSRAPDGNRFASLSSLECLVASAAQIDAVPPAAFIFHVSRCGSTLLSQMLSSNQQYIVLSEVPLIDELLRFPFKDRQASVEAERALKASITMLGRKRSGGETHLFIKLDCWHVFFAATLRKLYPDVPFVLLYRSPDAVIRSHQKRRGMHAVPGLIEPELFGMSREEVIGIDHDAYMGKVLAYYFSQFLTIAEQDERSLLLNYQQGSMAVMQRLADYSGIVLSKVEIEKMAVRSRYHSKYPDQTFSENLSESSMPAYLAPAHSMYQRLEQRRAARSGS